MLGFEYRFWWSCSIRVGIRVGFVQVSTLPLLEAFVFQALLGVYTLLWVWHVRREVQISNINDMVGVSCVPRVGDWILVAVVLPACNVALRECESGECGVGAV